MASREVTVLTCNRCKVRADETFPLGDLDAVARWMQAHGWQEIACRDLCPTCLMDHDASQRIGIRVGAR